MRWKVLAAVMLGATLLLGGCSAPWNHSAGGKGTVDAPPAIDWNKSDVITANIYLDGTTSMYGYVNYPGGTIYDDAVKDIDRTISETWKSDTIKYVKFGDTFTEMNRDAFLQMDKPAFYDQKDTSLQKVVEQADDQSLNIIVTDLFQTNQDLDSLVRSLKAKGLSNGKAVAVIGVKSQFNGKIFDVGKNMSSVDYASTDDPSSYRPVYLVVFGNENDTRAFVQSYQKTLPKDAETQVAFLSSNLGTDVSAEADKVSNKKSDDGEKAAKMAEDNSLLANNAAMQYRLKTDEKLSEGNVRVYGKNVIGKIPDSYSVVMNNVEVWNNNAFEKMNADNFVTGTVSDVGLNDGTANIAMNFRAAAASIGKKEGIYRVQLSLVPSRDDYIKAVNVFDDWNFDDSQISNDPEVLKQVGSKTLNISKFISLLAGMNYELNKPGFNNLYIYFNAKN